MRRPDRDILISRTSRAYRIPRKALSPWVQSPVLCGVWAHYTIYGIPSPCGIKVCRHVFPCLRFSKAMTGHQKRQEQAGGVKCVGDDKRPLILVDGESSPSSRPNHSRILFCWRFCPDFSHHFLVSCAPYPPSGPRVPSGKAWETGMMGALEQEFVPRICSVRVRKP